jgi:hypothetical protein
LTRISEIKNSLGIDTGIAPKISGFKMQMHDYQHILWAHTLAIYGSCEMTFNLKTSNNRADDPKLYRTPVVNISAYIQKLPNVTGDDI